MSKHAFSCLFVIVIGLTIAGDYVVAQIKRRPVPQEAMERPGDPPTSVWGTGISPARRSVHRGSTSYQVNVNGAGQNIVGDAANEPSITVDPTNRDRKAIGWRQFSSVTSNFRRAGYGYTINGRSVWTFPASIEPQLFRSDPVLFSDDQGRFFYLSLQENYFVTLFDS